MNSKEEHLSDRLWRLLDRVESIDPSPDFRARLWKRIERRNDKWWIPLPVPALAAAGFLVFWVTGVFVGTALFSPRPSSAHSITERSMVIFMSSVPQNSIEEIFLR